MLNKRRRIHPYAVAVLLVFAATVLTQLLYPLLAPISFTLFYAAIAMTTWIGGARPGLLAIVLSLLSSGYFFLPPTHLLIIANLEKLVQLSLVAIVSFLISYFISRLKTAQYQVQQLSDRRLQESEEQLRLAMQAARIGMWNWDLVTGEITWNPEHEQLLGMASGSFDGQYETFDARLHPDDREGLHQAIQTTIQTHGIYKHEYRVLWEDGSIHWVEGKGQAFYDETGQPVRMAGTLVDIDDRKKAEAEIKQLNADLEQRAAERAAELQQTNNFLNNFFDAASSAAIGLCIHDQNLRFIKINETLALMNGHSVEAHLNKTVAELMPELAPIISPLHQQVLRTGQPILDLEMTAEVPSQPGVLRYWSASYFPICGNNQEAQILGVGVIVVEISDRKRAEAILVEADRRWRSLLDNVQLIVVGLDHKGNVDYINPFFLKLTGYTEEEVLGKYWFDHFLPASQQTAVQICFQEVLENEFHPHYQNSIVTKLGEERTIAWNNTLLRNLEGQAIGTMSIGEDITERHKLEQMKAEFISIVSHELRTPLTSISGALELLSTGLIQPQSERGQETLGIASTETDRLTRLVNDILDLERLESGKIRLEHQPWDLAQLMTRAVDFMQLAATQTAITLTVEPLSVLLNIDGDRILQVLTNLLSNAVKFSPPHSTIWLTAEICRENAVEAQERTPMEDCSTHPATPYVRITVRDQGRGIPANKLESIFERFQQVDASDSRKKGGTGLGLAICYSIVQQHGGKIWVESILDQGSSFHFTLPLTTAAQGSHVKTDFADR